MADRVDPVILDRARKRLLDAIWQSGGERTVTVSSLELDALYRVVRAAGDRVREAETIPVCRSTRPAPSAPAPDLQMRLAAAEARIFALEAERDAGPAPCCSAEAEVRAANRARARGERLRGECGQ